MVRGSYFAIQKQSAEPQMRLSDGMTSGHFQTTVQTKVVEISKIGLGAIVKDLIYESLNADSPFVDFDKIQFEASVD